MEFDKYSQSYNNDLMKGVSLSGESADYFAQKRVEHIRDQLNACSKPVNLIVEFGCGIGNNIKFLNQYFPESQIIGLDISQESLEIAQERFKNYDKITFENPKNYFPHKQRVDLIFVNGVFHHISPEDHLEHLRRLYKFLKKGAPIFIFENNPFNPGARWTMKRIPFDRGAIMVNPYKFAKQVQSLGCSDILVQFFFIFPKFLTFFRFLENYLINLPIGAQYCVAGFKNDD